MRKIGGAGVYQFIQTGGCSIYAVFAIESVGMYVAVNLYRITVTNYNVI